MAATRPLNARPVGAASTKVAPAVPLHCRRDFLPVRGLSTHHPESGKPKSPKIGHRKGRALTEPCSPKSPCGRAGADNAGAAFAVLQWGRVALARSGVTSHDQGVGNLLKQNSAIKVEFALARRLWVRVLLSTEDFSWRISILLWSL